jgi:heat shock protein HslJ
MVFLTMHRLQSAAPWLLAVGVLVLAGCQTSVPASQAHHVKAKPVVRAVAVAPVLTGPASLLHTSWRLIQAEKQPLRALIASPSLVLSANQQVLGSTGCNALSGQYVLGETLPDLRVALTLRVSADHLTCEGALLQEAILFNTLDQVRSAKVQGRQLLLFDQQQRVIVQAVSP